jgi:catalase
MIQEIMSMNTDEIKERFDHAKNWIATTSLYWTHYIIAIT